MLFRKARSGLRLVSMHLERNAKSMSLNKRQFDVLVCVEPKLNAVSAVELAGEVGIAKLLVEETLTELTQAGLICDGLITDAGRTALEPYRVKRAVFMAAGFGSRMVPVTLNTPKPLVRVKGKRIIDSLLDAVIAAGIEEIYLVRGYLAEQFDQLLKKYPQIIFIENPIYNETNNISSAYFARHLLANSYVFEADLVLYNPKLITKYQYNSNYLGVPTDRTEDWCFDVDGDGVIRKLMIGGTDCYHMYGLSYWTEEDGKRLGEHLEQVFREVPGGKERYWDQVIFDYHLEDYCVHVRPCTFSDIVEIDTFNELKLIDPTYAV